MTPITKFCMFSLVLTAVHLFAIFEVSSFIRSGDIRGPNIKKWITCSAHDLIWPNFAFFSLVLTAIHLCAKFEVLALTVPEILGVPEFQKWVTLPPHDRYWPNFAFFSLLLTAIHLCAKFEVSSFNRSGDIRGSQNSKSGARDPHMSPLT